MNLSDQAFLDDDDDDVDGDHSDAPAGDFAYALNQNHHAKMVRRGPRLLVLFECAPAKTEDLAGHTARLEALAADMDWSVLVLVSRGNTWFRDEEVIAFFDAMVDGTLLDSFDDVMFYGAGPAGHAALSFAICAPLSRVLAFAPQASLTEEVRAWDTRFAEAADVEFGTRYPPSRENLEAVAEIYAAYDPQVEEDKRHMSLLEAGSLVPLVCRRLGTDLEHFFVEFGILEDIVSDAMEGLLDDVSFYQALRARRDNSNYLRGLISKLIEAKRPYLEALVLRNIAERLGRARFARRFEQLEAQLKEQGVNLPPSRNALG